MDTISYEEALELEERLAQGETLTDIESQELADYNAAARYEGIQEGLAQDSHWD